MWTLACTLWANVVLAADPLAERTLERGNGPEPDSLEPARAQGLSAQQILRDLHEGLFLGVRDGQPIPGVALRWEVLEQGLIWRFELDPDARYADGRPVQAADFVRALAYAVDPQTAAPYADVLRVIAGAQARLGGEAQAEFGVRAISTQVLEIRLQHPAVDLPARLSLPLAVPRPEPLTLQPPTQGQGPRPRPWPGNGAYRLVEWLPGAWVGLEVNPHHPQAAQRAIRRVRFHVTEDAANEARRFEVGELHLTETVPPQPIRHLRARYGDRLRVAPVLGTFYLGYNLRHAPLAEQPALREALSLAVDRERLVRLVTGTGEAPAWRLVPPPLPGAVIDPPAEAERLTRAQQLYREAGYGPQRPLQVELRYNTSSLNRRLMLAVAAMWEETLGVQTRLRQEDWKVFVRNRRAGVITQVFRGGWHADLPDALNFLELFDSASPMNAVGWRDLQFDRWLDTARRATDAAVRTDAAQAAEARLLQSQVILPLFHYTSKHLVAPEVGGFTDHPLDQHPTRDLYWQEPR